VSVDNKLRRRLCSVSAEQEHHSQKTHTTVPHPHTKRRTPFPTDSFGPYHWVTTQWTTRLGIDDRRSWMLTSSCLPSLRDNDHRPWSGPTVLRQRVLMVRITIEGHLQQRPPFHLALQTHASQQNWGQAKLVNSVSPSNRQTFGEEEPVGRTIPMSHRERTAGRLESVAHGSLCSAQRSC